MAETGQREGPKELQIYHTNQEPRAEFWHTEVPRMSYSQKSNVPTHHRGELDQAGPNSRLTPRCRCRLLASRFNISSTRYRSKN